MKAYEARPIKRRRRTKAEIEAIRDAIVDVVCRYHPMNLRQVYYQLVARSVVPKTEAQYKSTVGRLLVDMRRDGTLPYDWIVDNTRWMRKPTTYGSLSDMLERTHENYRRALWGNQDAYVEVWLEKDALAGVLLDVTYQWDVPLMVTRGYPSVSYVYEAAQAIAAQDKPAFLYYFGDHDPSGVDIDRSLEKSIREIAPDVDLHFERVAVTPEQVERYGLPTRPTKGKDKRAKNFEGESVEVDAIEPDTLRDICEACILQHIDDDALARMRAVESAERDTLASVIENLEGAA